MLSSAEIIQFENQRFSVGGVVPHSRQINNKLEGVNSIPRGDMSQLSSNNNLVSGTGHLPVSNSSNVPNTVQNSGSVYNSYYSSSTFNSVNNFEASLQWLTESRMPNNSLLLDKNFNCSSNSHSTPSHSCCVNRLGKVDNVGLCSPLSGDSFRSNRDAASYQTKPPALSVNVMDSVQNWFNLPSLPNQQYNSKLNDQNLNCSQISYPIEQATDLKQTEIVIPDSYFEQPLIGSSSNNIKQINNNLNELNNGKMNDINDVSVNSKGQNGYQTNFMSREWKQPLQAANYISSPTLFGALSESPDHYLYSIPPPVSSSSYCMMANYVGGSKQQQTCGIQQNLEKNNLNNDMRSQECNEQTHHYKINNETSLQHPNSHNSKSTFEKSLQFDRNNENLRISQTTNVNTMLSYSQNMKDNTDNNAYNTNGKYKPEAHYLNGYISENGNNLLGSSNNRLQQKISDVSKDGTIDIDDEIMSSSDESNIIVEESDETEEIDSVISIEEVKKTFLSEEPVELRCLVCNVKSSTQTPATNFIHMNDSFPLTSASKTPVASKLIQILPVDLQHFLKLHNSFMCRHCLNLIETVEVLEVKLLSVKQTLSENFSKTVQYFLPATPILEIENGKAKIIDKEIIPFIEKSVNIESTYSDDTNLVTSNKTRKDLSDDDISQLEDVEEAEDEGFCKEQFEDEEEELKKEDEESEKIDKESEGEGNFEGKQCSICSKILSSMRSYKKHMQLHTKSFSFYCEYCGKGFNSKNSLERHIESHNEDGRYQCEKCGKTFTQKQRLGDHLKKHLGEFKMNCAECGKGFMEKNDLQIHMLSHIKLQQYVCEICGSKFVKKSNLKNHLQICKKEEIKCNSCSEVFYSKTHLKKHEVTNHGAKPSTECNICGKTFVNSKDLKPHMRSHSQEKPFECKHCGKCYKSVGNLNHHSKIHNVDKLLNCTICGEGFQRKKYLEYHMNKHSSEYVFKCNECDKGFFAENNLLNHMKTHSSTVKTKTCPICSKTFHHGLQVHMRTHTGVKPYVCNHCRQAFTVNSALTRHIQSKHSNILET